MANGMSKNGPSPTAQLSAWISGVKLEDVPQNILERAKYLILDGVACGLVGAHLPWSEKAANALFALEPAGDATIIGWEKKLPPLSAALLNSSFIQGFELDDWHSEAPLHSNSILLPTLLATSEHLAKRSETRVTGKQFLLASVVGFEVGPRVGLGLHGAHILATGWHSGAVFGPSASAAAACKLLGCTAAEVESALGIACTQACGLMSAQFGSEVKRMQHGFAARNGLLAAFLAEGGYSGIQGVFEQQYGGFLKQFTLGNGMTPQYLPDEISKDLGVTWKTESVRIKPYAAMAGTHSTIDCVRKLQETYPERMRDISSIKHIKIQLGEVAYHHGGFKATRPIAPTGAQMSNAYVAATQMVHRQVLAAQFRHDMLENNELWSLVEKTVCELAVSEKSLGEQVVTVIFADGTVLSERVHAARGVDPPLSNQEIVEKFRQLSAQVIDSARAKKIEDLVLGIDRLPDVTALSNLLAGMTKNPIA